MRKGNINYKYLRRRKCWVRRNLPLFIIIIITSLIVIGALIFGGFKLRNHIISHNNTVKEDNTTDNETEAFDKQVVWIDKKEPVDDIVLYTPPVGVKLPYYIKVNRILNCATVYGIDDNGQYSIPVKAFATSCGRIGKETVIGENYKTSDKYEWRLMVDGTYGHYAFRFYEGYLFHSVPYYSTKNNTLETEEFNKLGSSASLGCVRMSVGDVLWIYNNCPAGTKVTIYDDSSSPGPLGKPDTIKIPENSPNAGWDPTDPATGNPWADAKPEIKGAKDITTKAGVKVNLLDGVSATDTCGNDVTDKLIIVGHYTFDQKGEYSIKYKVTDALKRSTEVTVKLNVTD